MRPRSYSLFPLAILTLLAGLTFWLERATRIDEPPRDGKLRHDPDFIVDNFTTHTLDAQGKLQYSLVAEKMLHYADDESTEVTQPRLTYFGRPERMFLSSKRANVSKEGHEVVLIGDVRAVREATRKDPEMVVTTSELSVYPDQDFAATDKPVKIVQGKTVVHGVGMELDSAAQVYKLLSNVRGIIYRNQ